MRAADGHGGGGGAGAPRGWCSNLGVLYLGVWVLALMALLLATMSLQSAATELAETLAPDSAGRRIAMHMVTAIVALVLLVALLELLTHLPKPRTNGGKGIVTMTNSLLSVDACDPKAAAVTARPPVGAPSQARRGEAGLRLPAGASMENSYTSGDATSRMNLF